MDQQQHTRFEAAVCPLDCPDTCSLSIEVDDDRIVGVRGSTANPYTGGVICSKVAKYYPEYVHGDTRLTRPLQRSGPRGSGQYRPISWEAALDRIYEGFSGAMEAHGAQSVLGFNYAGPHGELSAGSMDYRFFHRLGATQLDRKPLCGAVRAEAYDSLFGGAAGMPPEQAIHSDLIVVWGNNATVSNLHFARVIKQAREKGTRLVVIDPKRIRIAEQADLHLQIQPGTDVVLAYALANALQDRGGFDHAFIERWVAGYEPFMEAARRYGREDVELICKIGVEQFDALVNHYLQAERVSASFGNGIERGRSGGSGLRAAMSIQALCGQFGELGKGVLAKPGLIFPRDSGRLQRPDLLPEGTRCINILDVSKVLLDPAIDPPIKAMMIYNHNPVATHPDQNRMRRALAQEDVFIAGCDVVMTDSMAYADVILPAASVFETADLYGSYGHAYLQRAKPVIPPVGEALPNTEIFRRLAARFGFDDPIFRETDVQLMDSAMIQGDPRLQGYRPSEVPLDRALMLNTLNDEPAILCKTLTPATPSGKIELYSEKLERRFGCGLPRFEPQRGDYPLLIISPSSDKRTNATFGGCSDSKQMEAVEIHPSDARAKAIDDGDPVRLWNDLGEVVLRAKVSDKVKPGVLYSPKGTWLASSSTRQTVNALISADHRADIMDGACYNDTFVDIGSAAAD